MIKKHNIYEKNEIARSIKIEYVLRCIESCKTNEQMIVCKNWINNLKRINSLDLSDDIYRNLLRTLFKKFDRTNHHDT